jgi:hypothetical protein
VNSRPTGITISALALGWLALAGAGNAALRFSSDSSMGVLATLYAVAAGAACVGLWRMRPFAIQAFRAWSVVCVLLIAWFSLQLGIPWSRAVAFGLVAAVLLFFWHRYLSRRLQPAAA